MRGVVSACHMQAWKACFTSYDARCETGMLLKGPEDGPEPLVAAWFRLLVSHPVRVTEELPELLVDGPVHYEDRAVSA